MDAVIEQNYKKVKDILSTGTDVDERDKMDQTALFHAFVDTGEFNDATLEIFKLLVESRANINASLDGDGCSALVTAIAIDWIPAIDLLLDHGVDVDDDALAKFWGSLSSDPLKQMRIGQEINGRDQFIFTKGLRHSVRPLLCAIMFRRPDIALKLLDAGVDCDGTSSGSFWRATDYSICSVCDIQGLRHSVRPLLCAIMFRRPDIALKLLDAGVDCDGTSSGSFWRATDYSICSVCDIQVKPLQMAAYIGDLPMVYILLHKTKKTLKNSNNHNFSDAYDDIPPLWFAVLRGHKNVVKLLINYEHPEPGANHYGTALQVALQEKHDDLALMLLRAGYCLEEDRNWIEDEDYPTDNADVINVIDALLDNPRPLMDQCCSCLRATFGLSLNSYLDVVGAPRKVYNIVNFDDLSDCSWQSEVKDLDLNDPESLKNYLVRKPEFHYSIDLRVDPLLFNDDDLNR